MDKILRYWSALCAASLWALPQVMPVPWHTVTGTVDSCTRHWYSPLTVSSSVNHNHKADKNHFHIFLVRLFFHGIFYFKSGCTILGLSRYPLFKYFLIKLLLADWWSRHRYMQMFHFLEGAAFPFLGLQWVYYSYCDGLVVAQTTCTLIHSPQWIPSEIEAH